MTSSTCCCRFSRTDRLTDSHGRTVNFKNTIVIMTSNIGSPHLLEGIDASGAIREDVRGRIMDELRRMFRPEFLNRVDETVLFKPLALPEIERVVDLLIRDLQKRLAERGISLSLSEEAKEFVAREGFDPVYGARPLKRFLQRELETRLGRAIVAGEIMDGARVTVELNGTKLGFVVENQETGIRGTAFS
jgi:ATP-dependent Clp protease ATP-binding subunit ClpB